MVLNVTLQGTAGRGSCTFKKGVCSENVPPARLFKALVIRIQAVSLSPYQSVLASSCWRCSLLLNVLLLPAVRPLALSGSGKEDELWGHQVTSPDLL